MAEEIQMEEGIKKPTIGDYFRSGSCIGDPKENALQALKDRNLTLFTDIINESTSEHDVGGGDKIPDDHILNTCFESEDGKNLLFIAIEGGKHYTQYVSVLLNAGVPPNLMNEELNVYPLHFAAKERNADAMENLILFGANVNSIQNNGRTALHICAEAGYKEGVDVLLEKKDVEVDIKDKKGKQTPLYLAVAKSGSLPIVTSLLQRGADLEHMCFKKTIREHIKQKMEGFDPDTVKKTTAPLVRTTSNSVIEQLADVIDEAALTKDGEKIQCLLERFQSITAQLDATEVDMFKSSGETLLQKICNSEHDLTRFAKIVLEQNLAAPNQICEGVKTPPILLAAYRGNVEMLRLLLEHNADMANVAKDRSNETVLHLILKKDSNDKDQIEKWNGCLSFLFGDDSSDENPELAKRIRGEICLIVNKRDVLSNTALHYATQKWPSSIVRALLEHGANIGMKNKWNDVPIKSINPETMESFLDEHCLTSNYNTRKDGGFIDISHKSLQITFNYSFLAPSNEDLPFAIQQKKTSEHLSCNNAVEDEESQQKLTPNGTEQEQKTDVKYVLPETDSLWHMAQSKEHRHLLNHPVITSFLWLKWGRIRRYFNRNLRFYLLFVFVMTWYIFYGLGGNRKANGLGQSNYWPAKSEYKDVLPEEKLFNDTIYGFYIVFAVIMILFIIRDWRSDMLDVLKADKLRNAIKAIKPKSTATDNEDGRDRKTCLKDVLMVIASNWMEVALICLMLVLMIVREKVLWIMMLALLCGLIAREFFQLMASVRRYILSPENWIEVSMIILVCILLFHDDTPDGIALKRHMAAFAIVLSWTELITLFGKHPKLSRYNVYVTMLYKVIATFCFFLLWYAFFIVAFGLGFYILLHKKPEDKPEDGIENTNENDKTSDVKVVCAKEDGYAFFNSPWLSLIKTSTMFVGELEFSDIPVDLESPLAPFAYMFFLSFVFIIVVVLMNLLNGLAVSDIGIIQAKAEVIGYRSRVETISYTESILLGDPFNFLSNWPAFKWVKNIPTFSCCVQLYRHPFVQNIFHKITGATGILLFYSYLPEKTMTVKANDDADDCLGCLQVKMIDEEIIASAKIIILRKSKREESNEVGSNHENGPETKDQIQTLLDIIKKQEQNLRRLENKVDILLTNK